ncbi:MAG: TIGR00730 family Rossman fold protein [bacterium]|nr:TIGR00730 family Rossman fold protein [bacterium]
MNICVFCSAQAVPDVYTDAAMEFGALLGKNGHTLLWGGTDRGLMKVVADATQGNGGHLVGISMELLKHKIRQNIDETTIAKTLGERKEIMLERSDAFIAFPGGIGTLDEITEIIALKRHGTHSKPILFLDTERFYEGVRAQLDRMNNEGFLGALDNDVVVGLDSLVYFAATPGEAMRYIEDNGN